jgi:hypothetical protein
MVDGGFDSAPKPLEIHLSDFVVRRIDTYVEDFCDDALGMPKERSERGGSVFA